MALPVVSIFGNINKIDLKYLPSGKALCSYKIECSEKNSKGEWENLYIDGVSFEKSAEFINQYFKDGDACIATGKLITEVYEKDGKKVYTIKLKFPQIQFAPKSKNVDSGAKREVPVSVTYDKIPEFDVNEDEIPF